MAVARGTEPVLEHEGRDALVIKPKRVSLSFIPGEASITAAGANHHRRASGFFRIGKIRGEGGSVLVSRAERAGSAIGPERQGIGWLGIRKGDGREQCEQSH